MSTQPREAVASVTGIEKGQYLSYTAATKPEVRPRDEVIGELFRSDYAGLVRLAYCIVGDRCAAEDVVMDAFCSLHKNWSRMRKASAPLPYLRSAVIFGSRTVIRQLIRERHRQTLSAIGTEDPSSEAALAGADADTLAVAVRALPTRQQEVIVCRYYLELSEAETAELLGMTLGTVKQHAHRAREALSARLEGEQ